MDKNKDDQARTPSHVDGNGANERKGFPNYLLQRTEGKHQEEKNAPPAFKRKETRTTGNHVPFLEKKPDSYRQHRESLQAEKPRSTKSEERITKREERIRTSLPLYARHKSRRPFRPTELPSLWRKQEEEQQREYNLPTLKVALRILDQDLILIDLNPSLESKKPSEEGQKKELSKTKESLDDCPNRALHRSLSGIMEQERVHDSRKRENIRLKRTNLNGYKSYFG